MHLRAEKGFQPFLRDPAAWLAPFLTAQWAAHAALHAAAPGGHPSRVRLIAGLRRDCLAAGGQLLALPVPAMPLDPLAADYLIFGGRKGVAVMRRLLQRDPGANVPPHFRDDAAFERAWQETLRRLDAIDAGSARARAIVLDVETGFSLFEQAALACMIPATARTIS